MKLERWCFTDYELHNSKVFAACRAEDEFIARGIENSDVGVIVYRNGGVSNRYSDGVCGVTEDDRIEAEADESPIRIGGEYNDFFANHWRDVYVSKDGIPSLAD